jgi:hypothetical protein
MAANEQGAASANDKRQHSIRRLAKIDGIASKTAEALYQIGIHDYTDLDRYLSRHTLQQISADLQEQGVNRPPAFIDQSTWARQAREYADLESAVSAAPGEETKPVEEPQEAAARSSFPEHDATFTVSFDVTSDDGREPILRTTVCNRTDGDEQGIFQGSDATPWVNWMLERARLPLAAEQMATTAEAESARAPAVAEADGAAIEINDVQLSVVEPTTRRSEKRLKAQISFELSGMDAQALASRGIPFRMEGYTVDLETGASELVISERSRLVPEVLEYVGQQEFGLPDLGHYEFHSLVLLLPPGEMAAYHRGPTVRVVP